MGTRSDIIVQRKDGRFARIYCHWDGYLEHNGQILFDHYNNHAKAESLTVLGNLSSLAPSAECPAGHSFEHPVDGYCVAYGRDRGELNYNAKVFDSLAEAWPSEETWTEFTYVYLPKIGWLVASADQGSQALVPLDAALRGEIDVEALIKVPFLGVIGRHKAI